MRAEIDEKSKIQRIMWETEKGRGKTTNIRISSVVTKIEGKKRKGRQKILDTNYKNNGLNYFPF